MTIAALIQPEVAETAFSIPQEKHEAFVAEQAPLLGSAIEAYYQVLIGSEVEEYDQGETHQNYHPSTVETHTREQPKVGRNDPCFCGSGKKYKKCCLH